MADIPGARNLIQIEETQFRAGVSENIMSRVGALNNFHAEFQYDTKGFFLNGDYGSVVTPQVGVDGAFFVPFDCRIVSCFMFNLVGGSAGTTQLDIRRFTASNTPAGGASIFSTLPQITSAASANAYVGILTTPYTILENPAGTVAPVIATLDLDQGDMITCNLDSSMTDAQNCGVVINYRPR
jgi:hypothetical protein